MKKHNLVYQKIYIIVLWLFWFTITVHRYKTGDITIVHYILAIVATLMTFIFVVFYHGRGGSNEK